MAKDYCVKLTNTVKGEADYKWVKHTKIRAASPRGVARIISKVTGHHWRKVNDYNGVQRYDCNSAPLCFFVEPWNAEHELCAFLYQNRLTE